MIICQDNNVVTKRVAGWWSWSQSLGPLSGKHPGQAISPSQTKQTILTWAVVMTYPAVCAGVYGKEGRLSSEVCGLSNLAFPV